MIVEFEHKCAKYREQAIMDALAFAEDALLSRMKKQYYINIKPMRDLLVKRGVCGDCMDEEDREFTIRIDISIPIKEMIDTILHEMVHVQQYLSRRMRQVCGSEIIFDRVVYPHGIKYADSPWEIEAFRIERQLSEKYFGKTQSNN